MILLDTHVILWASSDEAPLGKKARALVHQAESDKALFVSAISAWEIAMLVRKGRLNLGRPTFDWIMDAFANPGTRLIDLDPAIAVEAGHLPASIHGDPGDRILIATARHLGCPLLTADRQILACAHDGMLQAIDANA